MNEKQLQVLLAIHEMGTISKAAQQLSLTQPTLHFHMKKMEEEYHAPLFLHRSGRITLSDQATILLHYAKQIQHLTEDAKEKLASYSMDQERVFRIGASMVPCKYYLLQRLQAFHDAYPKIPVSLQTHTASQITALLVDMKLDIGLIATSDITKYPDLEYLHLKDDPMVLVTSSKYQQQHLEDACFIMHQENSSTYTFAQDWIKQQNLHYQTTWYADSNETIKSMVMENLGISILSYLSVEREVAQGLLRAIPLQDSNLQRSIYLAYNKQQYELPVRKAFLDLLKQMM